MPRERQVSFAGGEIAPTLWGRTDLARYTSAARTLKNFIPSQHGVLVNRSGTQHVMTVPDRGTVVDADQKCRLVPFVTADDVPLVLIFTSGQIHYAAAVRDQGTGSSRYSFETGAVDGNYRASASTNAVPSPYGGSDLARLQFSQVGNVLVITSPDHSPKELRWLSYDETTGIHEWSLTDISFDVPDFPSWIPGSNHPTWVTDWGSVLNTPRLQVIGNVTSEVGTLFDPAGDADHLAKQWSYQVTRLIRDTRGRLFETEPFTVVEKFANHTGLPYPKSYAAVPSLIAVYADWPQVIHLGSSKGHSNNDVLGVSASLAVSYLARITTSGPFVVMGHRIYRGRDGIYGFIGETTGSIFVDDGADPDFSDPPPQSNNPFKVYVEEVLQRTEYPAVVAHFEGRRLFAATTERPGTVWGSALDQFDNFDEVFLPDDEDSFVFELASMRRERIRALVPRQWLLVFTAHGEWIVAGSGDAEVITPTSIAARPVSEFGCSDLVQPVSIANTVFWLNNKHTTPRAMLLRGQELPEPIDIGLFARHLFDGYTVVAWAFAENPHSVLWVVRSDGALLSLTYVPEQDVLAWAHHEIAGDGFVEGVCTVPEDGEDGVYLSVRRGDERCVERLAYRHLDNVRQGVFVDRAVSHNGMNRYESGNDYEVSLVVTGTDTDIGDTVTVTFEAEEVGAATKAGRVIVIYDEDNGEPWQLLLSNRNNNVYDGQVLNRDVADLIDETIDADAWAFGTNAVTGLHHLEGEEVVALADGEVVTTGPDGNALTVTAGAVVLPTYAGMVHVGLAYESDFESLDAVHEKGRQKIVKAVTLEMERGRGGYVGETLDRLSEISQRTVEDGYNTIGFRREEIRTLVSGQWATTGRIAYRQSDPLPVTILGLTREIVYGGD